ncbi:MAG: archaemetzincin family Zn-dependent metalloprotease [Nitrospirota bacterium]
MKKLLVIPIGQVEKDILEYLMKKLKEFLPVRSEAGQEIPVPKGAFNAKRRQYHSSIILDELEGFKKRSGCDRVLGITAEDLYVPRLNFVFGEAGIITGAAVVSIARLGQEFYGLKPDRPLLYLRTLKEAIHELGHTYGLDHCRKRSCIMFFSNSISDTDRKGPGFCESCRESLGI